MLFFEISALINSTKNIRCYNKGLADHPGTRAGTGHRDLAELPAADHGGDDLARAHDQLAHVRPVGAAMPRHASAAPSLRTTKRMVDRNGRQHQFNNGLAGESSILCL